VVKLDGQVVEERVLRTVHVFFAAYMLILAAGVLLVSLDNFSFTTTSTAVISCLGNIGPGLDLVGPMGNFSIFSPLSKLILSLCMIVGRLEIFPILVVFSKNAWRRS
jgi:trk system potassium uptake protein TrkH